MPPYPAHAPAVTAEVAATGARQASQHCTVPEPSVIAGVPVIDLVSSALRA